MGWFEKNMELEVSGSDGTPRKVKIPDRQFNRWIAEGKIRRVDCPAHILDPTQPERLEIWRIGDEVDQETYDRFKDVNGHVYVVVRYAEGQASQFVVAKDIWEKTKRDAFSAPGSSSLQEIFEEQYNKLLSLGFQAQGVAAVTVNTLWRAFNTEYPDRVFWGGAREADKVQYLNKMSDMIEKITSDEIVGITAEGTSLGARLMWLYLNAGARNDEAMWTRISDALEPFNKLAYDILRNSER